MIQEIERQAAERLGVTTAFIKAAKIADRIKKQRKNGSIKLKNRIRKMNEVDNLLYDNESRLGCGELPILTKKERIKLEKISARLWKEMGEIAKNIGKEACEATNGFYDLCLSYEDLVECKDE